MASVIGSQEATTGVRASNAGAPERCVLNGRSGVGALQVWRGQHGQVLGVSGSWRLELDGSAAPPALDELRSALSEGRAVRFEGRLEDAGRSESGSVTAEVRLSSIGTYRYVLHPNDGDSPTVDVTIVNFRPVDANLVS